jgi:hypothetical protein
MVSGAERARRVGAVAPRSASCSRSAVTQRPDLDDAEKKHSFDETAGGTVERAYSSKAAVSWARPYGLFPLKLRACVILESVESSQIGFPSGFKGEFFSFPDPVNSETSKVS